MTHMGQLFDSNFLRMQQEIVTDFRQEVVYGLYQQKQSNTQRFSLQ